MHMMHHINMKQASLHPQVDDPGPARSECEGLVYPIWPSISRSLYLYVPRRGWSLWIRALSCNLV
jgi:hypothetical protein